MLPGLSYRGLPNQFSTKRPDARNAANLVQKEAEGKVDSELAVVLSSIATACKQISSLVSRSGISGMTGLAGAANIQARGHSPRGRHVFLLLRGGVPMLGTSNAMGGASSAPMPALMLSKAALRVHLCCSLQVFVYGWGTRATLMCL
jgi:hypothetical protein